MSHPIPGADQDPYYFIERRNGRNKKVKYFRIDIKK
jgi:hypothetical protein